MGREMGERFKREGIYVYLLLVYSDLLHLAWVTEVLSLLSLCEVILFLPGVT